MANADTPLGAWGYLRVMPISRVGRKRGFLENLPPPETKSAAGVWHRPTTPRLKPMLVVARKAVTSRLDPF